MKSKKTNAEVSLNIQYIKSLSFENFKAPEIYTYGDIKPKIDISIDLNATRLREELFESEIVINVNATHQGDDIFSLKLVYDGIFAIKNVESTLIQENLFIDCPTILFPFVRQIVANTTRDANFPPIMLNVVDFEELYNSRKNSIETIGKKNDK